MKEKRGSTKTCKGDNLSKSLGILGEAQRQLAGGAERGGGKTNVLEEVVITPGEKWISQPGTQCKKRHFIFGFQTEVKRAHTYYRRRV